MDIEESVKELKGYLTWLEANGFSKLAKDSAIETLLTAYEKEKGENVKLRLQDIPFIEGELKAYKDRVNELKAELEKEKEEREERISNKFVSKDKIKAKIEVLKEDIQYSANPLSIDNSKFGIKVLQSLLEKE